MLGTHDLALFALTVLVLNATPGVDMMLVLGSTLKHGVRAGLASSAGIAAGCVMHTLAAAFGLAALLAASAAAFTVIKLAGAAYLLWLAIGMLREGAAGFGKLGERGRAEEPPAVSGWAAFRRGALTNALNPKVALFFLALLPQFIEGDAPGKTAAFLFLGAWFIVQGFAFLALLVLAAAPLRRWRPSGRLRGGLNVAGGGLFMLLAARLALAERS